MQVQIKHDNVDISEYVISYERETKICTGIGQLELTLSLTYPTTINPWDEIKIYENGAFQVKYYVSSVSKSQPEGTIKLECQDKSKRLVDYFIPDQYTITYPSYTGYWIKKFLTEAGVSYSFTVPDTGKLLSNYTTMGLAPAYEQIMTLLQLSGWYMFFDGNGVAKIGTLTSDFSKVKATFGKDKILEISKVTDDKMLRNRTVVWGAFNAASNEYAYADVKTNTRWNYDRRDLRTMVVSNGNIPNKSSAFGIANMLLKEFSRVTVEKHLAVAGAAGRDLGDVVRVRSNVYNGSGLITTYGVSMSKTGLVTNMILDERCPRLFGFFDFGDYVYVGTYGDGVWRKHLQYDPKWYNFSTGLTDLAVTDLHINNEVFSVITAGGGMFYSPDNDGPWQPFTIDSLTSTLETSLKLGPGGELPSGVVMTTFSGLMGRATIVDKLTNVIKYGIDTYSGVNYGDYFMMYSGMVASGVMASGILSSGVMPSGYRGWIVEYDIFTHASGVYPISFSGNFDIQVIDLENDGLNDYVSVKNIAAQIPTDGTLWNYGRHITQPFSTTNDSNGFSVTSELIDVIKDNMSGKRTFIQKTATQNSLIVYDDEISGVMEVITMAYSAPGSSPQFIRNKLGRVIDSEFQTTITRDTVISPIFSSQIEVLGANIITITKIGVDLYRVYYHAVAGAVASIFSMDWDAYANTVGAEVTQTVSTISTHGAADAFSVKTFTTKDTAYLMCIAHTGASGKFQSNTQIYLTIKMFTINLGSGAVGSSTILDFALPYTSSFGLYHFIPESIASVGTATVVYLSPPVSISIFQNGDELPRIVGWFITHNWVRPDINDFNLVTSESKEYLITGDTSVLNIAEYYSSGVVTNLVPERYFGVAALDSSLQLTADRGVLAFPVAHYVDGVYSEAGYITLSNTPIFNFTSGVIPHHLKYLNIYPLLNTENYYIARDVGGYFHLCSAVDFSIEGILNPPYNYELVLPISTPLHSLFGESFFLCYKLQTNEYSLVPFLNGAFTTVREIVLPSNLNLSDYKCIQLGGFFISEPDWSLADQGCRIGYLDMLVPYDKGTTFMVLQRDGTDFHLIQESAKPIRIDISNSTPLMTVLDNDDTFKAHYIFENEILTINTSHTFGLPAFGLIAPSGVRDYRYTMLEVPSGVEISSGIMGSGIDPGAEKLLLYAMGSGINFAYTNDLASGFVQMYAMPSGLAERIETSNFFGSGQYVFVTTSGDSPAFYQKDPMSEIFALFSGLPVSRATIIRLDDRL